MQGRDWDEVERSEEFSELVAARRRFVVPALIAFIVVFGGFLVLTGYARDFMGTAVIGSITWAWILALAIILLAFVITFAYGRFADSAVAPLVDRASDRARPAAEPEPER